MTERKQTNLLIKGAVLLTLAGLISKVLSAGYRVPLQNIAGDLGFYVYQQVYPILGMALILSLYGFPVAISKLVSELEEDGLSLSLSSFYIPAFSWLMGICGVIFVIGYTQAHHIAAVMGDVKLVPSLQAAFFVFLLVPFTSLIRGVNQGRNNMKPTAVSQVVEQLVRVTVIILTSVYIIQSGNIYLIGVGAAVGSVLGASSALVALLTLSRKQNLWTKDRWHAPISYIKTIFYYGLFICLNYMLLLLLQMVDSFTLVPGLLQSGMENEKAKVWKGIFDRGQPLIQLGTVLASSVALALIPAVTRKRFENDRAEVEGFIFASAKFTLLISSGASIGLVILFPYVNELFFQNTEGTGALRLLMIVIVFSSIAITTSSVLQGLGYVTPTALFVIGGVLIKLIGNAWLIPSMELHGAACASIISVAFVMVGNILILGRDFDFRKWSLLPWGPVFASLSGMSIVLFGLLGIGQLLDIDHRAVLLVYTLCLVAIGAMVYFVLLLLFGAFTKNELRPLPYSRWLIRLLPKGMKL